MKSMRSSPLTHEVRFTQVASGARIAWARSGHIGAPVMIRTAHWLTHLEHDLHSPTWQPLLQRLGPHLEIVRYDERGCGLSGADEVPPSLEASLEELSAVVAARGAPRFALIGIGSGVAAAVAYAAQNPDRVSHLVLLGGASHGRKHRRASPDVSAFHEAMLELMEQEWNRDNAGMRQLLTGRFMPGGSAEQAALFNQQQRLSCNGARAAAISRAADEADVREWAPAVSVPTLVLHSEGDLVFPLRLGHQLAAAVPNARFEALPSRNHVPLAPEPAFERLCELITSFVCAAATLPALTPAERDLATLVGQGLDNLQITAQLGLADKTVRNRLSALYAKLGVEGRAMAVVKVRELGL
jgi:pimeloyl-ACP methyl ester carboxylesterase